MNFKRRQDGHRSNLQPTLSRQCSLSGCDNLHQSQQLSDYSQPVSASAIRQHDRDRHSKSSGLSSIKSSEQTFFDDSSQYQKYLVEYAYEGSRWTVEISATSYEDARARVRRLSTAEVLGEVKATISIPENWVMKARKWLGVG